ncbi:acyl-CoA thioesterase [Sungkyunkwania multivorans]|uniref:Acyl-CoA thioesterase n=1 Tax=Sungkyunkwania multivorans TaxID=1173618 RepID=A0ABW3CXR6_9FLAO
MKTVDDLLNVLILEELNEHQFNGVSKSIGSPNVFGGQVLSQALNAAYRTIRNKRILHSMHAYFLEAGDLELPITFDVGIIRDGGSFSTRRVTAKQGETTIFILAASFHRVEEGHSHQVSMPTDLKQPEELLSWTDVVNQYGAFLPEAMKTFLSIERPIDFKPVQLPNPMDRKDLPPKEDVWFRLKGDASKLDLATKQQVLTYISDYNILSAAMNPHASRAHFGNTQMASLDHSMWYYRDFDFNDWMLFSMDSPSTYGARGFARGNIFTRDGKLIASVAQEGLMRPKSV